MKKIIAIVVAAVLVIGGAVGAYFLLKPEAPEEGTVSISASKGDMIEFKTPKGEKSYEILDVQFI